MINKYALVRLLNNITEYQFDWFFKEMKYSQQCEIVDKFEKKFTNENEHKSHIIEFFSNETGVI